MKVIDAGLGCRIIEPQVFGDDRGAFFESWNRARWKEEAGLDLEFVQSNVSESSRGVLRGLHYQYPNPQGKLVNVLEGEVYDVAVDVRAGSPTFGRWAAAILSADNKRHFWIPEGFAHGFCVLSEFATFTYQCTTLFARDADAGIRWNDADIAVDWPVSAPLLSEKDRHAPFLRDVDPERLPQMVR
jgi:dTDP-4-dehydrorhamnose 3,5-epimerase